ncbi:MAG: hypothetical protein J6D36_02460 [Erysipelotrichaceae bacterium]|nr:hypothetical protein [Erysipelotrichaceae bacterium]
MKRTGFLYEKMLDKELIKSVIIDGSKGKRKRHDVKKVMADVEGYTEKIYQILEKRFIPSKPKHVQIHDASSGKIRIIGVVPYFPDGIMHRLIVEAAKPVFIRGMYAHSCASIPGRGNSHAIGYIKKKLRNRKKTKYCAKLDIKKYYPSINQDDMMRMLGKKIKDKRFLDLIRNIITYDSGGLTIGFYLNQWLANVYLEDIDHMISASDGVYGYVRNMDDMVILGPNKKKLHKTVRKIEERLRSKGLSLKENWQVFKTDSRGIDFVGYRFFHGYTKLRKRNFLKLTRHCGKVMKQIKAGRKISFHSAAGLLSRKGQLKHCNGENILKKYYYPISDKRLKSIVSNYTRKQKEGDAHGPYGAHKRIS